MTIGEYAVVSGGDGADLAGSVVWWELGGLVLLDDLRDQLLERGYGAEYIPEAPSLEQALWRSAQHATLGKKILLRPVARNVWEAFAEEHVDDERKAGRTRLRHTSLVMGRVVINDGVKVPELEAQNELGALFAAEVSEGIARQAGALTASDVSSWLLRMAARLQATSLRQHGGFYFMPKGPGLTTWRHLASALLACGNSVCNELPAMRTDECARAVIMAVQRELSSAFDEMEAYLGADVSTRGLNSIERRLQDAKVKAEAYAKLFSTDLSALTDRVEDITGALAAARLERESTNAST